MHRCIAYSKVFITEISEQAIIVKNERLNFTLYSNNVIVILRYCYKQQLTSSDAR